MSLLFLISILYSFFHGSAENLSHDFHLSKCDIVFDSDEQTLQISLNIFIDDLENALSLKGQKDLFLCTEKELDEADVYISDYLTEKLRLKVDGNPVHSNYLGKEMSEDLAAVWCYLEVERVNPKQSISVEYDLLMEVFDDQKNLVKVQLDKSNKSFFIFGQNDYFGTAKL